MSRLAEPFPGWANSSGVIAAVVGPTQSGKTSYIYRASQQISACPPTGEDKLLNIGYEDDINNFHASTRKVWKPFAEFRPEHLPVNLTMQLYRWPKQDADINLIEMPDRCNLFLELQHLFDLPPRVRDQLTHVVLCGRSHLYTQKIIERLCKALLPHWSTIDFERVLRQNLYGFSVIIIERRTANVYYDTVSFKAVEEEEEEEEKEEKN